MEIDDATGHRYGNFPNYYSFHPPENRMNVLKRAGILDHILCGLSTTSREAACDECVVAADGADDGNGQRKKPRLDGDSRYVQSNDVSGVITYCDLGCNEGDLTIAMAAELLSNYSNADSKQYTIKCLGLDIDPKLIERANSKYSSPDTSGNALVHPEESDGRSSQIANKLLPIFKTANLCNDKEHNVAVMSFAKTTNTNGLNTSEQDRQRTRDEDSTPHQMFDLTSIFSTTMWIHVHSGDKGLKAFLERACGWTKRFLLVEPQPSGCYRKANIRLRKMGLPELDDVTSARLKLRPAIEEEIEKIIEQCGFQRVQIKPPTDAQTYEVKESTGDENSEATTSWNRTLHLYERELPNELKAKG